MAQSASLEDLIVVKETGSYVAKINSQVLKTLKGNIVRSRNTKIFDRIKADFQSRGELIADNGIIVKPRIHSAYLLVSTQLDSIEKGDHPFKNVTYNLQGDPIFNPSAGPESLYQILAWTGAIDFLRELNVPFKPWTAYTTSEKSLLADAFGNIVKELSPPQLSVLTTLFSIHRSHFVYPVLFLKNLCSVREYARAVFAGSPDVCLATGYTPVPGELFAIPNGKPQKQTDDKVSGIIASYKKDCSICAYYLDASSLC